MPAARAAAAPVQVSSKADARGRVARRAAGRRPGTGRAPAWGSAPRPRRSPRRRRPSGRPAAGRGRGSTRGELLATPIGIRPDRARTSSSAPGIGSAWPRITSPTVPITSARIAVVVADLTEDAGHQLDGRRHALADEQRLLRRAVRQPARSEHGRLGHRPARFGVHQQAVAVEHDTLRPRREELRKLSHQFSASSGSAVTSHRCAQPTRPAARQPPVPRRAGPPRCAAPAGTGRPRPPRGRRRCRAAP